MTDASLPERVLSTTTSICTICKRSVDATTVRTGLRIVLRKRCPEHGASDALISDDADWYERTLATPAILDLPTARREVELGCPFDCGPCTAHEQRLHLPIIPITGACNLDCPVCYTHNKNEGAWHMSEAELRSILLHLRTAAPEKRIVNLTGGEPTMHPDFERIVDLCVEEGIRRITISTHGLKLLANEKLVRKLAQVDARVILSFDSFEESTNRAMLGGDFGPAKMKVLDLLERNGVSTTLLPVIALGLNDHEIGRFVTLALERDFVRSLELHTMTYTGQSGASFTAGQRYPPDRVLADLERQTSGVLRRDDFVPSPVAHPLCYQVTYLLRLDPGRWLPFPRFMERADLRAMLARTLYLEPGPEMDERLQDVIARLWAGDIKSEYADEVLGVLRALSEKLFRSGLDAREKLRVAEGASKAVYLHSHMDEGTFDTDRIRQCPVAIREPDGSNIPSCAYNVLYRERDPRFMAEPQAALTTLGFGRRDGASRQA